MGHFMAEPILENRELSWLTFNRRVLAEADNIDNPLLERVRFLSITASNLDEFFMVRYAAQRIKMLRDNQIEDLSGLTPAQIVERVTERAEAFMQEQLDILHRSLLPALAAIGIRILPVSALRGEQLRWAQATFQGEMLPLLLPYIHTAEAQQPQVAGRALQMGYLLASEKKGEYHFATTQVPSTLPRLWQVPDALGDGYVLIEEIIRQYAETLFPGHRLLECHPYRITRDEDFTVPEAITGNLVAETKKSLKKRKTGDVVRLEVDAGASMQFLSMLRAAVRSRTDAVYRLDGPLDLKFLARELCRMPDMDAYLYQPFKRHLPRRLQKPGSIFDELRRGDIFLHHPYDSFDVVTRFVREAASDPRVLAINMTLYRVSGKSPVIRALCDAAEAGKRVTVLLELKARFDEENNIRWAEVLQRAGCEVIYGLPRLKTHSKIALVVRREEEGLVRYVHLGTGNYNDVTAKQYTDMGILTCDISLGEDAQAFFNMITGFSQEPTMQRLIYAPRMLRPSLTMLIQTETENARAGRPSGIFAKMNSLVDPQIIHLLYEASAAGVPIRLIVRGVCCLRAGVPELSETIEVRSIIGRFLEHSRVFRFENGGSPRLYLSSADWMPRNLNRRIELMFPVLDDEPIQRINEVLDIQWLDNVKSWRMLPDGSYMRMPRGTLSVNAQESLFRE